MSHEQRGPRGTSAETQPKTKVIKNCKQQGGFDCEFIERPQEAFQANCPICLMILCEPYQVNCCGNSFCQTCIERVQADKKPCPICNSENFLLFPNKGLKRSLYAFQVECSHKKEGCQWVGELWGLEKHLNNYPELHEQLTGCKFAEIECHHCCEPFQRCFITAHMNECPQRPFSCVYCGSFRASFEDVVANHWPVCRFQPVPCPNKCGEHPKRQNVEHHLSKDCSLTVVNCDFHYAGCKVPLFRKDVSAHQVENLTVHMSLMAAHSQKEREVARQRLDESQQQMDELKRQNQMLISETRSLRVVVEQKKEKITQLEQKMAMLTPSFPADFTMVNFDELKRDSRVWYSPPFHTHPHGYKMCLRVITNYELKGTEIAIGACLMCGEFDSFLAWPFQGAILMELLNQLEDRRHMLLSAGFHRSSQLRVIGRERAKDGCRQMTVPYCQLAYSLANNCQYLKDNCLCLRVLNVSNVNWTEQCLTSELCVTVPPVEFRMTDFSQHRRDNDKWYSLPFYSHANGYKLCLSVQSSRFHDAVETRTPLGVAVHILSGKFDHRLKWPFYGDVTVQLLNQLGNKQHHERIIRFNNEIPVACARVTAGGRAMGKGSAQFIALDELDYDPARKCQYLKDDCIAFRINKVVVKK